MRETKADPGIHLKAAAGRDLPDEDAFVGRVMDEVADGGGVETLSAEVGGSPPRRTLGLAAAALLGALGVWAVAGGYLSRSGDSGIATDESLAAPAVELPDASTAVPIPRPIRITVKEDGTVFAGGDARTFEELRDWLASRTGEEFAGAAPTAASDRDVLLRADRRVRWRTVQWVLQTCADPSVRLRRIWWAVDGGAIPAFLPTDRGLSDRPFEGRPVTLVATGAGKSADAHTQKVLENLRSLPPGKAPVPVQIQGAPEVAFGRVVELVDLARAAGAGEITFLGAPPPPRGK